MRIRISTGKSVIALHGSFYVSFPTAKIFADGRDFRRPRVQRPCRVTKKFAKTFCEAKLFGAQPHRIFRPRRFKKDRPRQKLRSKMFWCRTGFMAEQVLRTRKCKSYFCNNLTVIPSTFLPPPEIEFEMDIKLSSKPASNQV